MEIATMPKIKRRGLLGGVLAASCTAVPVLAAAREAITWSMGSSWPADLPILHDAAVDFAETISAASGGRLTVKVVPPSVHGMPGGLLDALKAKKFDLVHTTSHYYAKQVPAIDFFTTIPFGLTAEENHAWIQFGGGQALFEEALASHGVLPITVGNTSVQYGGWFAKEIKSKDDLRGIRMRISGFPGRVIGRLGAIPVELSIGQIKPAFEAGKIDAAEAVVPVLDLEIPFEKYAPFQYDPWHEPDAVLHAYIDKQRFAELAPDLQEIVRQSAQSAALRSIARGLHLNAPALAEQKRRGASSRPWPADVLLAMHKATQDEIDAISDPMARRVVESLLAYKLRVADYSAETLGVVLATR